MVAQGHPLTMPLAAPVVQGQVGSALLAAVCLAMKMPERCQDFRLLSMRTGGRQDCRRRVKEGDEKPGFARTASGGELTPIRFLMIPGTYASPQLKKVRSQAHYVHTTSLSELKEFAERSSASTPEPAAKGCWNFEPEGEVVCPS